jgi:peptidyl-tRNA hydrolase
VLKRPSRAEKELLAVAVEVAGDAVSSILADGVEVAMNQFNSRA